MKTKDNVIAVVIAVAMLLPAAASAKMKLTGARVFGVGADGKREGSYWNTIGNDGGYNIYFFTGTPRSPKFLNSGNTDDSLNPKYNLSPGTYTFGFAGDTRPCPALNLELCFNDDPQTRISVTARDGVPGEFSGTTTFRTDGWTVTLTAIQTFPAGIDLVSAFENKPDGTP